MTPDAAPQRAAVVGSGLIGASVGMALRAAGWDVVLYDADQRTAERAAELGAGRLGEAGRDGEADVAVLAMPPGAVPQALRRAQEQGLARTYVDVASVKVAPAARAAALGCDLTSYVGGHPMAGRERTGPGAARGDLFQGRPFILVPGTSGPSHLERAERLVTACGARAVVMDAEAHDAAMAVVSHVPQVAASLVAARLGEASADAVGLAGQGLRDVTRIAASDPALWEAILEANARPVLAVLAAMRDDLDDVISALDGLATAPSGPVSEQSREAEAARVRAVIARGAAGRARLPGKHGAPPTTYSAVPVVVPDRPGELARLFVDAGRAGINVEDVSIEHSPGQPVGLVELAVRPDAADPLTLALREVGWTVQR